ncbi:hypothetical protein BC834DRAFT_913093, partial [Gloeopeniophorella convolvens]
MIAAPPWLIAATTPGASRSIKCGSRRQAWRPSHHPPHHTSPHIHTAVLLSTIRPSRFCVCSNTTMTQYLHPLSIPSRRSTTSDESPYTQSPTSTSCS